VTDILAAAHAWLADNPVGERMGRAHDAKCHLRHLECLVNGLVEEIERLREERRWVPVGQRLPADNVAVLCCGDGIGAEMVWREKGKWHLSFVGTQIGDSTYTHWQPLPPGPEGDGNG